MRDLDGIDSSVGKSSFDFQSVVGLLEGSLSFDSVDIKLGHFFIVPFPFFDDFVLFLINEGDRDAGAETGGFRRRFPGSVF